MSMEQMQESEYDSDSEQPTPEQLFMRMSVECLTAKQKAVWEYHNFDRLTQEQIGAKLGITHQAVAKHITAAQTNMAKWCANNMKAYEMLVKQIGPREPKDRPNGVRESRDAAHKTPVRNTDPERYDR
jgi:predicted DNA-binding protein YlxM (UPF0122 family)